MCAPRRAKHVSCIHPPATGKFLGQGTYATVFACHKRSDPNERFAIKKMKIGEYDQGLAMASIREVQFLQELQHDNIVKLIDVFSSKDQNINLVIELLPLGDLEGLIKDQPAAGNDGTHFGGADIKAWMGMLGRAIWYCHENFVLHRDIKPNNLMFAPDGELKLADFGLARSIADPNVVMTADTITRWYRPPELFYGARHYNGAVDIWSVGCVFAELCLRAPYMWADTDVGQIAKINELIGSPTEANWPGVSLLPNYAPSTPLTPVIPKAEMYRRFGQLGYDGVDLLMHCLILDPRKRCTAKQFLQNKYFTNDPRPTPKHLLPKKGGGIKKMGKDLAQMGGEVPTRPDPVARKLNF